MDFGGKFGPPEADEVKKCAKTYVKKAKKNQICAQKYMAGPKMNADRWFIEECGVAVRWGIDGFLVKKKFEFFRYLWCYI
jgi:hypothetical protein